ncbi:hypothetical protein RD792_017090 [Penstemon davidsonii]|uniref:Bet v I/Major latex protein domain-containing protein n=1 Tax=Penstemon davidsonii TaxID=160366 RepID=A0ABR0CLV0_9LAMI|nr:hypothetical protein RD792_017090 [Penstemon davidsonii]
MGVITYEHEITSSIPPNKMFKALILDTDNLIPNILPLTIKSVQILEGNRKISNIWRRSQFISVKQHIDGIDEVNHTCKYSVIEGGALAGVHDSISYVVKIEADPRGGSVCKNSSAYHTKGKEHNITEDKIKEGKEKAKALFKAIEAHLRSMPIPIPTTNEKFSLVFLVFLGLRI